MRRIVNPVVAAVAALAAVLPASPAHAGGPSSAELEPRKPGPHSVVFTQRAVISAEQARIWTLLTDLPGYENWNPFVIKAEGRTEPGAEVSVEVVLGQRTQSAQHVVLTVDPQREFCWKDAGWNSWFVYGQRCRWLEPQDDGTVLFSQELLLDGPFAGAASHMMGQALRDGMAAETAALKEHAERG